MNVLSNAVIDSVLLERDAARWRFVAEYGFPVRGPQWMAFINGQTAVLGDSAEQAVDRAIEKLLHESKTEG